MWGVPRIVGELRKLGINVAKSTVEKYRVHVRKPPSPTWKTFLNNHVQDLVALDFFNLLLSPVSEDISSLLWSILLPACGQIVRISATPLPLCRSFVSV